MDTDPAFEPTDDPTQMTPEMREILSQHIEAFRKEWLTGEDGDKPSAVQIAKKTREQIVELLPDSVQRIKHVIKHAPIDSRMANDNAKWVIECAMSDKGIAKADDPMQNFLDEMLADAKERVEP